MGRSARDRQRAENHRQKHLVEIRRGLLQIHVHYYNLAFHLPVRYSKEYSWLSGQESHKMSAKAPTYEHEKSHKMSANAPPTDPYLQLGRDGRWRATK